MINDRRYDLRAPVADAVNLSWTDPTGEKQQGPADLANISRSGASVRSLLPMRVGTVISLDYQNQQFSGRVTYCKTETPGYVLGIEFEDGYRWSPRKRK
jgi:PilZ domain